MKLKHFTLILAILFFFSLGLFFLSIPDIYSDLNNIPSVLDQTVSVLVITSVLVSLILALKNKFSRTTFIVSVIAFLILEFKFFQKIYLIMAVKQSPLALIGLMVVFVFIGFTYYREVKKCTRV